MAVAIDSYLFVYNGTMAFCWSIVLAQLCRGFAEGGLGHGYSQAGSLVRLVQAVSLLETVHAALGLVRSGVRLVLFLVNYYSNALN